MTWPSSAPERGVPSGSSRRGVRPSVRTAANRLPSRDQSAAPTFSAMSRRGPPVSAWRASVGFFPSAT
jgi:hypothetical protein